MTVNTNELPTGTYPLVRSFRDAFAATNPFATVFNNAALAASNARIRDVTQNRR